MGIYLGFICQNELWKTVKLISNRETLNILSFVVKLTFLWGPRGAVAGRRVPFCRPSCRQNSSASTRGQNDSTTKLKRRCRRLRLKNLIVETFVKKLVNLKNLIKKIRTYFYMLFTKRDIRLTKICSIIELKANKNLSRKKPNVNKKRVK